MNNNDKYDHSKRPLGVSRPLKTPIYKGSRIIEWE